MKRRVMLLGAALSCGLARELGSETLRFTTSYPSPAGVYAQLITTGGSNADPKHTQLVRDNGNLYIGQNNPWGALVDIKGQLSVHGPNNAAVFYVPATGTYPNYYFRAGTPASYQDRLFVGGASGNVGIGTIDPQARLDVRGNVAIQDGTQGQGKVLTSDASGKASWQTPAGVGAQFSVALAHMQTHHSGCRTSPTMFSGSCVAACNRHCKSHGNPYVGGTLVEHNDATGSAGCLCVR